MRARTLTLDGETKTIDQWVADPRVRALGISLASIPSRIACGWTDREVLTVPRRHRRPSIRRRPKQTREERAAMIREKRATGEWSTGRKTPTIHANDDPCSLYRLSRGMPEDGIWTSEAAARVDAAIRRLERAAEIFDILTGGTPAPAAKPVLVRSGIGPHHEPTHPWNLSASAARRAKDVRIERGPVAVELPKPVLPTRAIAGEAHAP